MVKRASGTNTIAQVLRESFGIREEERSCTLRYCTPPRRFSRRSGVISRSHDEADPPQKRRIRPRAHRGRAFAHLPAPWLPSHHLLLTRERPFLAARQYGGPFRRREIAFSASSAPALSILTRVNFLFTAYINFRA